MKKFTFDRISEEQLISFPASLGGDSIALALDTGASYTTVDLTPLLLAGYSMSEAVSRHKIETASGVIDAYMFVVKRFECLGVVKYDYEVCAYDFFAYHYIVDFEGVIGLNFFKGVKLCIDLDASELSIQEK